jgi:hypothetical protein
MARTCEGDRTAQDTAHRRAGPTAVEAGNEANGTGCGSNDLHGGSAHVQAEDLGEESPEAWAGTERTGAYWWATLAP